MPIIREKDDSYIRDTQSPLLVQTLESIQSPQMAQPMEPTSSSTKKVPGE